MIAKRILMLLTLSACVAGLSALGSLKNPVTRPNNAHGHFTVVVSLADGSFVASEQGQATHSGQYITHFEGQMDLVTFNTIWMEGYVEAANGDRVFAEMTPQGGVITGGTGRFEGATGSFTMVTTDVVVVVDPIAGTMTMTGTDTMEGTITY